jgi:hypothetical protein
MIERDEHPMDYAARYGVNLWDTHTVAETAALRESIDRSLVVDWADPRLAKILRLRLIGASREFPFWDVSYVYGELRDGRRVRVTLPVHQLPRYGWQGKLIALAREEGVYAKGLGLFDPDVVSTLAG